jgi:mRNA interferase MazF
MGTILICDFSAGFKVPEMVKVRPVVVISPKIAIRSGLCTVVPDNIMPYHHELRDIQPPLPSPYNEGPNWIKGDMVVSVGLHRLNFVRMGKAATGERRYRYEVLPPDDLKAIRTCVLRGLGFSALTKHL